MRRRWILGTTYFLRHDQTQPNAFHPPLACARVERCITHTSQKLEILESRMRWDLPTALLSPTRELKATLRCINQVMLNARKHMLNDHLPGHHHRFPKRCRRGLLSASNEAQIRTSKPKQESKISDKVSNACTSCTVPLRTYRVVA